MSARRSAASSARGNMRHGLISLLTVVIVLSLATAAVLTVATAGAMSSLARRQASMTAESYDAERSAQLFLANVDDALADMRADGAGSASAGAGSKKAASDAKTQAAANTNPKKTTDDAKTQAAVDTVVIEDTDANANTAGKANKQDAAGTVTISDDEPGRGAAGAVTIEDDGPDVTANQGGPVTQSLQLVADELVEDACADDVEGSVEFVGDTMTCTFLTTGRRMLVVTLNIRDDATYEVASWKLTAAPEEESTQGNLWTGF